MLVGLQAAQGKLDVVLEVKLVLPSCGADEDNGVIRQKHEPKRAAASKHPKPRIG
jgi:hypothetical protein